MSFAFVFYSNENDPIRKTIPLSQDATVQDSVGFIAQEFELEVGRLEFLYKGQILNPTTKFSQSGGEIEIFLRPGVNLVDYPPRN
jgi:hypothetical protein